MAIGDRQIYHGVANLKALCTPIVQRRFSMFKVRILAPLYAEDHFLLDDSRGRKALGIRFF